jgi:hypothetical protein
MEIIINYEYLSIYFLLAWKRLKLNAPPVSKIVIVNQKIL